MPSTRIAVPQDETASWGRFSQIDELLESHASFRGVVRRDVAPAVHFESTRRTSRSVRPGPPKPEVDLATIRRRLHGDIEAFHNSFETLVRLRRIRRDAKERVIASQHEEDERSIESESFLALPVDVDVLREGVGTIDRNELASHSLPVVCADETKLSLRRFVNEHALGHVLRIELAGYCYVHVSVHSLGLPTPR